MNMIKTITKCLFLPIALLSLASCNALNTKNAIKFNDDMLRINQTIVSKAEIWGDSLQAYQQTGNYSELKVLRMDMEQYITEHIEEIKNMEGAGKGAKEFKNAELSFLKTEKDVIHKGFGAFESLTATSTDDELQEAYDTFQQMAKLEGKEMNRLQNIQKRFAEENHFTIGTKDLTK